MEFCLFGILPLWKRSTFSLTCRSDRLCPSNGKFYVAPWQHLFKIDMATSHPRTSWPAWTLLCWPLILESVPFLQGPASWCPIALRVEHCKASLFCVAPGNVVVDTSSCPAPQQGVMLDGDTDPISQPPEISPTGQLQKMHPQ